MKKFKMSFKHLKNPKDPNENDHLGFERIDIIEFNYDGKGTALTLEDGEIGEASPKLLRSIFWGGWYKRIS